MNNQELIKVESMALQRLLNVLPREFVRDKKIKELLTNPDLNAADFKKIREQILSVNPLASNLLKEAVSSLVAISMDKAEPYSNSFGIFFDAREIKEVIGTTFNDTKKKVQERANIPLVDTSKIEDAKKNQKLDLYSRLGFATIVSVAIAATYFIPIKSQEDQNLNCQTPKIEIPKQIPGY